MIEIGTSGWVYDHWKGKFYPENIDSDELLTFYADHFETVEINNTFYGLPEQETVEAWRDGVPEDFLFAVKINRYITHMKNLLDPEASVARFMDRVRHLNDTLGPILIQLPPRWNVNVDRLRSFIPVLPEGYRFAFEFRDVSWYCDEVLELLRDANCAFCIHDHVSAPSPTEVTADFVYVRYHGPEGSYAGSYDEVTLAAWTDRITSWEKGELDVYAYFNNDNQAHAVENAKTLRSLIDERL